LATFIATLSGGFAMRWFVLAVCSGLFVGLLLTADDRAATAAEQRGGNANDRAREIMERQAKAARERARERELERAREKEQERQQQERQERQRMDELRRREEAQRQQRESARREAAQREASRDSQERARELAERMARTRAANQQQMIQEDRQREQQILRQAERKMQAKREAAGDFRLPLGNQPDPNPAPAKPAAAAKPAKPAAPPPEKLTDADLDAIVETLKTGDDVAVVAALRRLAAAQPSDERGRVASFVVAHVPNANPARRQAAAQALAVWGSADSAKTLMPFVDEADKTTRHAVIRALGEWKHTPAIEGLAERLATPADRVAAANALKEMGNEAEHAMLKLLDDEDLWVRVSAIDVLSKVGRQTAMPALQIASESDTEEFVRSRAKTALRDIQSRPATDAG
jgi:hypothetical protein